MTKRVTKSIKIKKSVVLEAKLFAVKHDITLSDVVENSLLWRLRRSK